MEVMEVKEVHGGDGGDGGDRTGSFCPQRIDAAISTGLLVLKKLPFTSCFL